MKQVWKCSYCRITEEIKEDMSKHEATCFFNPTHRGCYTCAHYDCIPSRIFGDVIVCDKKLEMYEYDCKGNCPKWQEELK